jgi:hypothetical protein
MAPSRSVGENSRMTGDRFGVNDSFGPLHAAQRRRSVARADGGKFANANLMTADRVN